MSSSESGARPQPRPGVLAIEPYVPGKRGEGSGKIYKLSSNETPFGPSPQARQAFCDCADALSVYPDGSLRALREAIGARHGLDAARVVCGAGSDELIFLLAYAFVGPGDEAVYTRHGFGIYRIATLAAGGTPVIAEERDLTANVDAILATVTARTKIVFLANPNNPTGTYLNAAEVGRLATALPSHVLLVLDAAYAEYVTQRDYSPGLELVAAQPNVAMTRTFSKIYGLAALRLGWLTAQAPICEAIDRLRGPFNISTPAMRAGIAALADAGHVERSVAHNEVWLPRLAREIGGIGIGVTPSVANFLLLHFADPAEARAADAFLTSRGLILRTVDSYGLPQCLRVTVGTQEANLMVIAALAEFKRGEARD